MKDYTTFSINDFVMDEYFQSWVLKPDDDNSVFWETWLTAHPEKKKTVEDACHILKYVSFSSYTLSGEDVADLWKRIRDVDKHHYTEKKFKHFTFQSWHNLAAVIVFLSIIAFVFFWNRSQNTVYKTAYGQTKTIVLPDSSTVILNSNSSIALASRWDNKEAREVWLTGEAFFSVTHTKNHQPFRVITKEGMAVEVLGTSFNVYHRLADTRVVLNTGLIQLRLPTHQVREISMKPGEMVEYKENHYKKKNVDPAIYTAWTQRKLILDHTSLRDMIKMIKDNYGISIHVSDDEFLDQTVSGSIPISESKSLIQHIAKVFRLQLVKQGDEYFLQELIED